jgi:hypothetical protein
MIPRYFTRIPFLATKTIFFTTPACSHLASSRGVIGVLPHFFYIATAIFTKAKLLLGEYVTHPVFLEKVHH